MQPYVGLWTDVAPSPVLIKPHEAALNFCRVQGLTFLLCFFSCIKSPNSHGASPREQHPGHPFSVIHPSAGPHGDACSPSWRHQGLGGLRNPEGGREGREPASVALSLKLASLRSQWPRLSPHRGFSERVLVFFCTTCEEEKTKRRKQES